MSSPEEQQNYSFYNESRWIECTFRLDFNHRRIALFLLYLLIFVAGLVGNVLVLWVNWRRRHSASGVLFCVLNVSLSDMMVILVVPFFMLELTIQRVWLWGQFMCTITNLIYAVNFYSSSFFLALMTLERYLSLTRPTFPALFPTVGRRRWWLCAGVWLFSIFLGLLEKVHMKVSHSNEPGCHMWPDGDFLAWIASFFFLRLIFQFVGPSVVIITCNVLIARAVRAAPDIQDKKSVWLVHVFSLVFVFCWFPYHFLSVIEITDFFFDYIYSCNIITLMYFFNEIFVVITFIHCVANPILYNFLSKSFRSDLLDTMATCINKEGKAAPTRAGSDVREDVSISQSDVDP